MCRASLFLWFTKKEKRSPRACLENPECSPFRSTLQHRHARRRSGQSERRRSSDVAAAHTSASPTVAHARSTPTASEPGSRRPTSPGPSGRVVGTEAARASFKSPPRERRCAPMAVPRDNMFGLFAGAPGVGGRQERRRQFALGPSQIANLPGNFPMPRACAPRARTPEKTRTRARGPTRARFSARNAKRRLVPPADDASVSHASDTRRTFVVRAF